MSEFAQTHIVWYALISVFERVIQDTAVVAAWGDLFGNTEPTTEKDNIMSFLIDAVSERLTLELTRIFDTEKYKAEENCSLKLLRACCISDTRHFPKGENDEYILMIDSLCELFDSIIPKEVRNKQIAHLDLKRMFSRESVSNYAFSDLLKLVEGTQIVLSNISACFIGVTVRFQSVDELKNDYVQSLRRLLGTEIST